MKFLILCSLLIIAFGYALPNEEESQFLFTKWMQHHGKTYNDMTEFSHRFNTFKQNLKLVLEHNEEAKAGKHSFTLGMNKYGDLSNQEYRTLLTFRAKSSPAPKVHLVSRVRNLPTTVDWRTKGVVTGVKDQGQCGSCWAFSAVGGMEGAHALATGNLVSFSEQQLVDCVNNGQCTCDVGGFMQDGFADVIQRGGIEGEADYPYCTCSGNTCKFSAAKVKGTISSYANVTSGSETDLQSATASRPVSVAIDASSFQFQLYSGGVFDLPACKNGIDDLDHGVLVVGYGTYENKDYWLVKNSWGGSWGLSGYIMMSRNKSNQCGIATDASYPIV